MRYKVIAVGDELARLMPAPTLENPSGPFILVDERVNCPGRPEDTSSLIFAEYSSTPSAPPNEFGWMETRFLEQLKDEPRVELVELLFVQECVFAEIALNAAENSGPEPAPGAITKALFPVVADYLIAWALLETEMKNVPPDPAADNADGPFRLTDVQWTEYLKSTADTGVTPYYRTRPNLTVYAAIDVARAQMVGLSTALTDPALPDGPYVPSFLNVYHSQILGVPAAAKLQKLRYADRGDTPIDAALKEFFPDEPALLKFLKEHKRKKYFFDGETIGTLNRFFILSRDDFDAALKKGFDLIKTHLKNILPDDPVFGSNSPWMQAAEEELRFWRKNDDDDTTNVDETDPEGLQKVVQYFSATDSGITTNEPWCGAFVAHCLSKTEGLPPGSIVPGSARASSWIRWGNAGILLGSRHKEAKIGNIPLGAIVVLWPNDPKRSGHVAFFAGLDGERLVLLGGNQSNRVSKMQVDRGEVRAMRWLDIGDPAPDADNRDPAPGAGPGAIQGTTNRDVLILARTIYGEARGELAPHGRKALEAVANVVVNRATTRYRGKTIEEVCLRPWQFSCWNPNDPNRSKISRKMPNTGDSDFDVCFQLASEAASGNLPDRTDGARHYHAHNVRPDWASDPNGRITVRIGRHVFYKGVR